MSGRVFLREWSSFLKFWLHFNFPSLHFVASASQSGTWIFKVIILNFGWGPYPPMLNFKFPFLSLRWLAFLSLFLNELSSPSSLSILCRCTGKKVLAIETNAWDEKTHYFKTGHFYVYFKIAIFVQNFVRCKKPWKGFRCKLNSSWPIFK